MAATKAVMLVVGVHVIVELLQRHGVRDNVVLKQREMLAQILK